MHRCKIPSLLMELYRAPKLQGLDERFRRGEDVIQQSDLAEISGLSQVKSETIIFQSGCDKI